MINQFKKEVIMYKKPVHLIFTILILSIALTGTAKAADPDLVGWWRFD